MTLRALGSTESITSQVVNIYTCHVCTEKKLSGTANLLSICRCVRCHMVEKQKFDVKAQALTALLFTLLSSLVKWPTASVLGWDVWFGQIGSFPFELLRHWWTCS